MKRRDWVGFMRARGGFCVPGNEPQGGLAESIYAMGESRTTEKL